MRSTSAAVSAEVASSRIRSFGDRPSARAISIIWRRESGRLRTISSGCRSSQCTRASRRFGAAALGAPVNQPEPTRRLGRADVLGDGEIGDQRQFLEDCNDAGAHGFGGAGEADRPALELHGPGVGLNHAAHDLDQGRLACAVLAEHRMNPAPLDASVRRFRAPELPRSAC